MLHEMPKSDGDSGPMGDSIRFDGGSKPTCLFPRFHPMTCRAGVPEILLADLPRLGRELATAVSASGFRPDLIVYVETGARLVAAALSRELSVPAAGVCASRPGGGLKVLLAPLAARLPKGVRDRLRRWEERSRVHGATRRKIEWPPHVSVSGRRVLLVDDAADTGNTIAAVRAELVALGAEASASRTAVLAATTAAGRREVDFFLFDCNCRMPWSADSRERRAALVVMRAQGPLHP